MAWFKLDQTLAQHRKVYSLCATMRWTRFETLGRLQCFWGWVLTNAPSGVVTHVPEPTWAEAAGLDPRQGRKFKKAMIQCQLADDRNGVILIHDWLDYAGEYLRDSLYRRHPKQWLDVCAAHKQGHSPTVGDLSADSPPTVSRPSPDCSTLEERRGEKRREVHTPPPAGETGAAPQTGLFQPPSLDQALSYAKKTGWPYSDETVTRVWQSFESTKCPSGHWYLGRRPVSDWRHAMELRCGDYQQRLPDKTAAKKRTETADRMALETRKVNLKELIGMHPANKEGGRYDEGHSPEKRAELRQLRAELNAITERLALGK